MNHFTATTAYYDNVIDQWAGVVHSVIKRNFHKANLQVVSSRTHYEYSLGPTRGQFLSPLKMFSPPKLGVMEYHKQS